MKAFLFSVSLLISLPSYSSILDCSRFFENGETEQGGGSYFIQKNRDQYEVWLNPYLEQDQTNEPYRLEILKKIPTPTKTLKLYSAGASLRYEFVMVGETEMGVLDIRSDDGWSRTYKCE